MLNVKVIAWNDQQMELADSGRRWVCYLWQSSWNMACGRNEKFNIFDLACGFLNNSLRALAHMLPTSGDYEPWQSMILEPLRCTCYARTSARPTCANDALWLFLVIVFFFTLTFLISVQQRWGSSWYTDSGLSTKVFHVVPIVQDLSAADVINYPQNTDLVTLKWCYPAWFVIFMPIPRCNTPPWRILDLLPLWPLLQPFSPTPPPTAFDVSTVSSYEVSDFSVLYIKYMFIIWSI